MKIAITEAHRKEIKSLRDQLAAFLKNQNSSSAEYSRLTQKSEQLTEEIATLEKGDTESDGVASALATKRVQLEEVAKKISKLYETTVAIDPFANDRIMNLLRELTHYAAQACLPAIKDYVGVIADKIRPWCLDDANAMVCAGATPAAKALTQTYSRRFADSGAIAPVIEAAIARADEILSGELAWSFEATK